MMKKDDLRVHSKSIVYFTFSLSFTFQAKSFSFFHLNMQKNASQWKQHVNVWKGTVLFYCSSLRCFYTLHFWDGRWKTCQKGKKSLHFINQAFMLQLPARIHSSMMSCPLHLSWPKPAVLDFQTMKNMILQPDETKVELFGLNAKSTSEKKRGIANHLVMKQGGGCIRVVVVFKQQGSEGF